MTEQKKRIAREAEPKTPTREQAEEAVRTLIRWAGDDPNREGLLDTPDRFVRAYEEFFAGYAEEPRGFWNGPSRKPAVTMKWFCFAISVSGSLRAPHGPNPGPRPYRLFAPSPRGRYFQTGARDGMLRQAPANSGKVDIPSGHPSTRFWSRWASPWWSRPLTNA